MMANMATTHGMQTWPEQLAEVQMRTRIRNDLSDVEYYMAVGVRQGGLRKLLIYWDFPTQTLLLCTETDAKTKKSKISSKKQFSDTVG